MMLVILGIKRRKFIKGEKIDGLDQDIESIIRRMLDQNPIDRPSFKEVLFFLEKKQAFQPEDETKYIELYQDSKVNKKSPEEKLIDKLKNFDAYFLIYHLEIAQKLIDECYKLIQENKNQFENTH